MERSLSVLLPVHNAQTTLSQTVHEVLDVAPELARRFDIVIIDDGSTDATSEIAQELASRYPQVRVVYRGQEGGREVAIQSGLAQTQGEMVLVRDDHRGIPLNRLPAVCEQGGRNVPAWESHLSSRRGGYQVLHRAAGKGSTSAARPSSAEPVVHKPARPNYLAHLRRLLREQDK